MAQCLLHANGGSIVVTLLLLGAIAPRTASQQVRAYSCDAQTSYACGKQIGEQAKDDIADFFAKATDILKLHDWVQHNISGHAALASLEKANRDAYPHLIEEVKGTADGAGVPYSLLLVANLQFEISSMRKGYPNGSDWEAVSLKGCTDFHSPTAAAWVHNEDDDALDNKTWYFVTQRIVEPHSEFFAFTYPGQLAGWAYGLNKHGVAQSINALSPAVVRPGLAVQFVARDALDAVSLDDAIKRVTRRPQAGGQHFNFGSLHEPHRQVSVETSPLGSKVIDPVPDGFSHANLYISLNGSVPQLGPDAGARYASSIHRVEKLRSFRLPVTTRELVAAISDRSDEHFPIYRRPKTAWDYDSTESSVLFDANDARVTIWTGRPSTTPPVAVLRWNDSSSWPSAFSESRNMPLVYYA